MLLVVNGSCVFIRVTRWQCALCACRSESKFRFTTVAIVLFFVSRWLNFITCFRGLDRLVFRLQVVWLHFSDYVSSEFESSFEIFDRHGRVVVVFVCYCVGWLLFSVLAFSRSSSVSGRGIF